MSLPLIAQSFQFHARSLPWIHLAWLAPALFLLYLHAFYRKRRALERFASAEVLRHLTPSVSWRRQYAKCALVLAAVLFAAISIARPQWGSDVEEIRRKGIDLVVCLDLSKSMLAEDVPPNRAEWAKADLQELLGGLTGDRIGLVAFAGRAEIRCPLTFDYGFFRRVLSELKIGSVAFGGTAIGDGLHKSLECFQDTVKNHKAILLITDGEDHEAFVKEAAEKAREKGVRIFAIGIGDTGEGVRIPVIDEAGNRVYLKDTEGKEVWTKMDPRVLLDAAQITDGGYAPAYLKKAGDPSGAVTSVRELYARISDKVARKELQGAKEARFKDRFQWPLALAWALLALEPLLRTRKPSAGSGRSPLRADRVAGTGASKRVAAAAAALLALFLPLPVRADEFSRALEEGNRLFFEGKFPEAEEKYLQAKTARQEAAEVPYNIANTHFAREDFPKAIEIYGEALRDVRERSLEERIRFNRACAQIRESEKFVADLASSENLQKGLDLLRQAIGGCRDVLEIDLEHLGARHNLAIAQLRVKNLLDQLKRLREEAEKKAKDEEKDKQDPLDVLKQLIEEEKAEIELTRTAGAKGTERTKLAGQKDRLAALGAQQDGPALASGLDAILADPEFVSGANEASEASRLARGGDLPAARKKLEEASERLGKEIATLEEAQKSAIEKDRADQTATLGKAGGLVQGLRDLAEGKPHSPPPGAQPPPPAPPPEPLPPEVKERLLAVAGLTEEAAGSMGTALGALGEAKLPDTEAAQEAALERLQKALEEAEKLPKKEQPPQDQKNEEEKKDDRNKDGQKKDDEKKQDGEKKDQEKKDEGEKDGDQKKDEKKAAKKDEKKEMTKEEAEQALRQFREKDAEKLRDRERRAARGGPGPKFRTKDW